MKLGKALATGRHIVPLPLGVKAGRNIRRWGNPDD
jgi:hypothetical protein